MPWSHPAAACASTSSRCGRSGSRGRRHEARLQGRLLHAHVDDAVLQPRPNPYGPPKVFLAAVGELMTEVARRSRRRRDHPRLHDRALREGSHACPRSSAGSRRPAGHAPTSRSPVRCSSSPARTKKSSRRAQAGGAAADRVLRLDARVPRRARAARLGRSAARAQHAVEAGRVGEDGRAHRRRRAQRVRGRGRARRHPEAACSPATAVWSTASRSTPRTPPIPRSGRSSSPTSGTPADVTDPVDAVHAANAALYAALEARATWTRWPRRRGALRPGLGDAPGVADAARSGARRRVVGRHLRGTPAFIQFVLTDEQVVVAGDTAWVTLDENILQSARCRAKPRSAPSCPVRARTTAANVFVRARDEADGWVMVVHHSSPVVGDGQVAQGSLRRRSSASSAGPRLASWR